MAIVRATVSLDTRSGEPKDRVVNVWHFNVPAGTALFPAVIAARLANFYEALGETLSSKIIRGVNTHTVSMAGVTVNTAGADDDVVTAPYATIPFTITTPAFSGSRNLPSEVAICLSFMGDYGQRAEETGNTRPRSRRRGRVFLGPFNDVVNFIGIGNGVPTVEAGFRTQLLGYYDDLVAIDASPITHVIYSPTDGQANNVEMAWVDNAFDIIRSRGEVNSDRTTKAITQQALQP